MLSVPSSRRAAPRAGHLAVVVGVLAVLPFAVSRIVQRAPDFDQACRDGDPFLVVSSLRGQASRSRAPDPRAPSIVLFRDTPNDNPQYALATFRETGAVWGLAYRRSEPAVYAAAYHKRGLTYGPDGPGAVYRIDLTTGDVDLFVTVPDAGDQRRGPSFARGLRDDDADAGRFVGKTALGDIDLDADEKELFVVNLASRRIYRYEMPSGTLLGSFDHGAAAEPWSREARPFGLAYHAGHLYHGVVNDQGNGDEFVGVIYRSEPDGSAMTAVAVLDLRYRRDGIRLKYASTSTNWGPWQDGAPMPSSPERPLDLPQVRPPQPMLTDLTFTADGTMVVGLRDRRWDLSLQWIKEEVTYGPTVVSAHGLQPTPTPAPPLQLSETGMGFGDLLLGRPDGEQWRIQTDPEHFDDTNAVRHAESALGGLAWIPDTTTVAATAYGAVDAHSDAIIGEEGVHWYDVPTGNKTGLEGVGRPGRPRPYSELLRGNDVALAHCTAEVYLDFSFYSDLGSLGDLEVLCLPEHTVPTPTLTAPVEVTPTPTPTDTPVPPTVSVTPTDTPTSPTPTPTVTVLTPTPTPTPTVSPTPTPRPRPCYLPINVRESPCKPDLFFGDVALVLDMSTSMRHSTQTGQVKLDAVLAAARYFVGRMKLESTEGSRHDQVAVVGFNDQAWIQSPLGNDRAAIDDALSALPEGILEGTRLDLAFATGAAALPPERRITGNLAVMVVLTDGLPNRVPVADDGTTETTVRHAADAAKAAGIRIYTIGVGRTDPDAEIAERIDAVLLAACASSPEMFYHEPDAAQLDRVYGQIVTQIDPCRGRSYWGNR